MNLSELNSDLQKSLKSGIVIGLARYEPNKKFIVKPVVPGSDILHIIRERTSCINPNAYFIRRRYPDYPLKQYEISPIGIFSPPFIYRILIVCRELGIPVTFTSEVKKYLIPFWKEKKIEDIEDTLALQYRYYQKEAIKRALSTGRGLIKIPTAGGKTLVLAGLYSLLRKYLTSGQFMLFLFPNTHLVHQTFQAFIEYGIDEKEILIWTGEEGKPKELTKDFQGALFINSQILLRQKKGTFEEIQNAFFFFCDEVHTLKRVNKISKWLNKYLQADYRFGLTGTFPPEQTEMLFLESLIGPPIFNISLNELEKEKFTTPFKIIEHRFKTPSSCPKEIKFGFGKTSSYFNDFSKGLNFYQAEIEYLVSCPERNHFIVNLVKSLGFTCILILVDRIEQGLILEQLFKKESFNIRVEFISGEMPVEERKKIIEDMEKKEAGIIIAISRIFSTGINFPALQHIVFASPFKAKIKLLQSIGRALRLHPSKKLVQIHDIIDDTYYSRNHYLSRRQILQEIDQDIQEEQEI